MAAHTVSALWMGVDLGTQSAKVAIVDDDGVVVSSGSAALRSIRQPPRHEQDPREWISQARAAMTEALAPLAATDRARIAGVSICATSGTITLVDADGAPTTTGLMYDDARAGDLATEVAAADPERWNRLGYRIQPTWALPKILWLVRQGLVGPGDRVAHQGDVLGAAMVGRRVDSDWSHALKSGYDLIELQWPASALERLGIDPAVMPPTVSPGTELGRVTPEWAAETGLAAGTPLFAGMTDGCAAQLGAGTLNVGDWHTVIGTTMVFKAVSPTIIRDETGAVYSHRAPHGGLWFPGGASSVGAGIISSVLPGADLSRLTGQIAARFDTRRQEIPLAYPLAGRGERFPVVRPDAQGFVLGEATGTGVATSDIAMADAAGHLDETTLLASILLGVACVERLATETMMRAGVSVDGTFSSSGGGVKNAWWTQLRADVLGRPIAIPASAEGTLGMAILAASSAHSGDLAAAASQMSRIDRIVEPSGARKNMLDDRYGGFIDALVAREWIAQ